MNKDLTQEYLKECLDYNPETGILTWRVRPEHHFKREPDYRSWNARFSGGEAGCVGGDGYMLIKMVGRRLFSHRLIWLWMTGEWPKDQIDHINHQRDDNRWGNLREVTHNENHRNRLISSINTSECSGVHWHQRDKRWHVRINYNKARVHLGGFSDFFEACCVRKAAEIKHGYHSNHGSRPLERLCFQS